jgi:glucose/arabinose dehydrogenase
MVFPFFRLHLISGFILLQILVMSSVIAGFNSNSAFGQDTSSAGSREDYQTYGCYIYGYQSMHCDPTSTKSERFQVRGYLDMIYRVEHDKPSYVEGKSGQALEMTSHHVSSMFVENNEIINPTEFSISFWAKQSLSTTNRYYHVISHTDAVQTSGWLFHTDNPAAQSIKFGVFNTESKLFSPPAVPTTANSFTHIVGTFDGKSVAFYSDGRLVGKENFTGTYKNDPGVPLKIAMGAYCQCSTWTGIIDEIRFYDRALSEGEVQQLFNVSNSDTLLNGLIAYWKLDGSMEDSSGNANDGILNTMIAGMDFAPDGRLFISEKNTGNVRIIVDGKVVAKPFITISDQKINWEQGLLSLKVDPKFEQNHFVYLYYTYENENGDVFNRLVRFTDDNNVGVARKVLIDSIPASKLGFHSGGGLAFDNNDKLYLTVGDRYEPDSAQDELQLNGKVLRINRDGTVPSDNPFKALPQTSLLPSPVKDPDVFTESFICFVISCKSPVYNIGHRNMYGIAFDNEGFGISTEAGDHVYDEVNAVTKGGNFGWPNLQLADKPPELSNNSSIKPLKSYWLPITPTGAIYYDGDKFPVLEGYFLFGTYTGDIFALKIDPKTQEVLSELEININPYPEVPVIVPVNTITSSPDGSIYVGSYEIYNLQRIDDSNRKQILFPVEFNSSAFQLANLEMDVKTKTTKLVMEGNDDNNTTHATLSITYPSTLLGEIVKVVSVAPDGQQSLIEPNSYVVKKPTSSQTSIEFDIPFTETATLIVTSSSMAS